MAENHPDVHEALIEGKRPRIPPYVLKLSFPRLAGKLRELHALNQERGTGLQIEELGSYLNFGRDKWEALLERRSPSSVSKPGEVPAEATGSSGNRKVDSPPAPASQSQKSTGSLPAGAARRKTQTPPPAQTSSVKHQSAAQQVKPKPALRAPSRPAPKETTPEEALAHLEQSLSLWAAAGLASTHGHKDLSDLEIEGRVADLVADKMDATARVLSSPKLVSSLARRLEKSRLKPREVLYFSNQVRNAVERWQSQRAGESFAAAKPSKRTLRDSLTSFSALLADHRRKMKDSFLRLNRDPATSVGQLETRDLGVSISHLAEDEKLQEAFRAVLKKAFEGSSTSGSFLLRKHPALVDSMNASGGDHFFNLVHVNDALVQELGHELTRSGVSAESFDAFQKKLYARYKLFGLVS
ncbi:hypothetical protein HY572_04590 [Candidatus Micrarchaeota archaeon]|nr:hypothetical protein [Candidatus Micrarchaeota archaeon]